MNKAEVNNQSAFKIDKKSVRKVILKILKYKGMTDSEVSIVFLDKNEIRKLNARFRKLDRATDVLSFEGEKKSNFLGEIAISPEIVKKRSGRNFEAALTYVLIHGMLHLIGYNHIKVQDRKKMRAKEMEISRIIVK